MVSPRQSSSSLSSHDSQERPKSVNEATLDSQPRRTSKRKSSDDEEVVNDQNSGAAGSTGEGQPGATSRDLSPSKKLKARAQQSTSPQASTAISSQPPQRDWGKTFADGMERQRKCRAEKESFPEIESLKDMWDDHTIEAIAAFWVGSRRGGRHFAFGGRDVFTPIEEFVRRPGIVGGPYDLIMPIRLPLWVGKEDKGHFVFIRGHWNEKENLVTLTLWDSLGRQENRETRAFEKAQGIIIKSRWPYDQTTDDGKDEEQIIHPKFKDSMKTCQACPDQEGGNTCGFYMILNAWCTILGIPIVDSRTRRTLGRGDTPNYGAFHKIGREILNLARVGCMDAKTVQAFLIIHGYTEDQTPVANVQAVEMVNDGIKTSLWSQYVPTPNEVNLLRALTDPEGVVPELEIVEIIVQTNCDGFQSESRMESAVQRLTRSKEYAEENKKEDTGVNRERQERESQEIVSLFVEHSDTEIESTPLLPLSPLPSKTAAN